MATFTAEQAGALSDGATFGNTSPGVKGTDWPNETDDVDAAGYALTQGTATGVGSITDLVTGGGSLTLTGSFTCPDVQEVEIVVPDTVTATISFGVSGVDPGCAYSGGGYAIECQAGGTVTDVTGDLENSGAGKGVFVDWGTVVDFSGTLNNTGAGTGAHSYTGEWYDFSGTLNNTGAGPGADNTWSWGDFSGTLNNSGAWVGLQNDSTWYDFSGTLNNTGNGKGVLNNYFFYNFPGTCLDSGSGVAWEGAAPIYGFAGIVGRPSSQADLVAENIVAGKTILGVVGTRYVASTTPSNAYLHRLIPSEEYRVDKRTTVFRPHTPLSGDTLNGAQSTPQSGVRISSDYPEGV